MWHSHRLSCHLQSRNWIIEPNPIASALGLGNCQIARMELATCPTIELSAPYPGQKKPSSKRLRCDFVTGVARYGPPPDFKNMQYSHRCHQPSCLNPQHGTWESAKKNHARHRCKVGESHLLFEEKRGRRFLMKTCEHDPVCISGSVVRNMEHHTITQLPT